MPRSRDWGIFFGGLVVCISIPAVTAANGFAFTATHFSKRRKVSKRLRPGVRRLAEAPRSLATVSIRGHRLRSASRRPPLDVCGFAARRYAPNPLMNTSTRPAEGAKDQRQDQHLKPQPQPQPDQKIAASFHSTAPTGDGGTPALHHSTGRALARQQLLILICPPLWEAEWRCSSGGQARSAVRRSRTHREEVVAKQTVGDAPR